MQYICTICGYMYDDALEAVPFAELPDDWTCPLCGASKDLFEPVAGKEEVKAEKNEEQEDAKKEKLEEVYSKFTAKEMAALFSNLANGCEKQYEFEAQKHFMELAKYFESQVVEVKESKETLLAMLKEDNERTYSQVKVECNQDRGMLRALTWGEKVSKVQQMMLSQGASALEGKNIYVCSVCGFMYVGQSAPKICPVCKVPDWKFIQI